jgi:hypothetical protein
MEKITALLAAAKLNPKPARKIFPAIILLAGSL